MYEKSKHVRSNGNGPWMCVCMNVILAFIACNIHSLVFQTSHSSSTLLEQQTNLCTHYYFKFKSSSDQELKWLVNIPQKTWDQMKTMSLTIKPLSHAHITHRQQINYHINKAEAPMHTSSTNKLSYKKRHGKPRKQDYKDARTKRVQCFKLEFKLKLHYLVSLNLASWAQNKLWGIFLGILRNY